MLMAPTAYFQRFVITCLLDITTWMSNKDININISKHELIFATNPLPLSLPILADNRLHFFFHSLHLIVQKVFSALSAKDIQTLITSHHLHGYHQSWGTIISCLNYSVTSKPISLLLLLLPYSIFSIQQLEWSFKSEASSHLSCAQNPTKTSSNVHWEKCWDMETKNIKQSSYLHGAYQLQQSPSVFSTDGDNFSTKKFSTKKLSSSEFLHLSSINILDWIILCFGGLSCAL